MLLKILQHAIGVDISDWATKKGFIALKAEVGKLDIAKLVNPVWIIVPTSLNNLKTQVDDLDFGKNEKRHEKIKGCSG